MARRARRSEGRRPRLHREGASEFPEAVMAEAPPSPIAENQPLETTPAVVEATRPCPGSRVSGPLLAEVALVALLVLGLALSCPAPPLSRPQVPDLNLLDRAASLQFSRDPDAVQQQE